MGHFMSNNFYWRREEDETRRKRREEGHRLPPAMTVKRKGKRSRAALSYMYRCFSMAGYNDRLQGPVTMGQPITIASRMAGYNGQLQSAHSALIQSNALLKTLGLHRWSEIPYIMNCEAVRYLFCSYTYVSTDVFSSKLCSGWFPLFHLDI
jgi:hypothetical protein